VIVHGQAYITNPTAQKDKSGKQVGQPLLQEMRLFLALFDIERITPKTFFGSSTL
jgi:hypothetical protein